MDDHLHEVSMPAVGQTAVVAKAKVEADVIVRIFKKEDVGLVMVLTLVGNYVSVDGKITLNSTGDHQDGSSFIHSQPGWKYPSKSARKRIPSGSGVWVGGTGVSVGGRYGGVSLGKGTSVGGMTV